MTPPERHRVRAGEAMHRSVWVLLLWSAVASAQAAPAAADAPSSAPPASTAPAPMPSQEEIERAIKADAAANKGTSAGTDATAGVATANNPGAAGFTIPMPRVFQSLNPDLSLIADFAGAAFAPGGMQMLGGHDPTENGFNFQALELAFGATVDPYFRFDANIVLSRDGIEVEEAYGTTLELPAGLQVRAGKFLTRFGRFNNTHPHTWNFSDQPVVLSRFFGGEGNRGVGIEVSDLLKFLPWYAEVVFSATDPREPNAAVSFLNVPEGGPYPKVHGAQDFEYTGALKQFWSLSEDVSLSWGLSAMTAPNFTDGQTEIYGTDVYLKFRPVGMPAPPILSLNVEALWRRFHTNNGATYEDTGAFAQLFYRFQPRWAAGVGAEYVTSASGYPADPLTGGPVLGESPGVTTRYKADLTFYPTEFSRLRLQYDAEPPGATHKKFAELLLLNVEFAIGAHGAHAF